jgi:hypothetical protein
MPCCADWTPGPILPPHRRPSVPVSIRMPRDLYEELGRYAKRVRAQRTYLILECLRRLLAAKAVGGPARARVSRRSRARPGRKRGARPRQR